MKKELKIMLGLASVIVVGTVVATFAYRSATDSPKNADRDSARQGLFIRGDSPTLGPSDATVTVVEFLDPECESCRAFFPIMKEVLKKYEGKVFFVVRYMTFHTSSVMAIAATEAAGRQGKYWEMQEHLFASADEWGHQPAPIRSFFVSYARVLGLDMERFQIDLDDPQWSAKAQRDVADGTALGVKGTPTIFVNETRLRGLSGEALESSIEAAFASK